jgi:hypothetical protein
VVGCAGRRVPRPSIQAKTKAPTTSTGAKVSLFGSSDDVPIVVDNINKKTEVPLCTVLPMCSSGNPQKKRLN